jgi:hypothetical protein
MQSGSANLPARLPYGEGVYRRRILLVAADGRVTADLEDDFHRYGVEIAHDGGQVGAVRGRAGRARRQYDIAVPDRVDGVTRATLQRDGELVLAWDLCGSEISDPPPYAGRELRGASLASWAESELDPDTAEAAIVLRRGSFIANGRLGDFDSASDASVLLGWGKNSCHSFTPGIAEKALRVHGSTRDFTHHPERLLADVLRP